MNKNISNSLLSMLFLVSVNATAASTLQWEAVSVDVLPNAGISLGLTIKPENGRQAIFDKNSNNMDFTQTWNFNVKTKITTSGEEVNFFNTQNDNTNATIYNVFIAGSDLGITSQWAFSTLLATGSHQSLKIATGNENITSGFSAQKNDTQIATTPIPAIAWILGSCLFGISGLLFHRKSVAVN